jgi:hypothetical protein
MSEAMSRAMGISGCTNLLDPQQRDAAKATYKAARTMLEAGGVVPGVGPSSEWLDAHNVLRDLLRLYQQHMQLGSTTAADARRAGQQKANAHSTTLVSKEELDACIQALNAYVEEKGVLRSKAMADKLVPAIRATREKHKIGLLHLFKMLKQHNPKLRILVIGEAKRPFTAQEKPLSRLYNKYRLAANGRLKGQQVQISQCLC